MSPYTSCMRYANVMISAIAGALFGVSTSLVNNLSSEYGSLGMAIAGSPLSFVAGVMSNLIGHGWSWAVLAVLVGSALRTPAVSAVGATLALVFGTVGYYLMDSVVVYDPLALTSWQENFSVRETVFWFAAALIFGIPLGLLGSGTRRPGLFGLLCGLTLTSGASLGIYMVLQDHLKTQRDAEIPPAPDLWIASFLIWAVSACSVVFLVYRFVSGRRE